MVPMPHAKSGKIKVLAVASKQRWPGEPNVPTMEESGFPRLCDGSWVGLLAPKGARPSPSSTSCPDHRRCRAVAG
jgi:tripartite-type tricarboxylate transporter receptor subunit TctC